MSSFVFYGPPGSGKSTLAASMTELGYRVHFLDADKKIRNLKNIADKVEDGSVTYTELEASLTTISMKARAEQALSYFSTTAPKGYIELCGLIDDLHDEPPEDASNVVLVLDSATRIGEHLKRLLKHFAKKPKLEFAEWDAFLANFEEISDTFFSLQPDTYAHCILIAHSKPETNKDGNIIGLAPHIDGQFKDKLGTYVEEMYYCEVEIFGKTSTAKFKVTTKPVGLIKHARSSLDVKTYVDANMKEIMGGK